MLRYLYSGISKTDYCHTTSDFSLSSLSSDVINTGARASNLGNMMAVPVLRTVCTMLFCKRSYFLLEK